MPVIDVDGFPLHYLDEGQGLPVLLFHAYPLGSGQFRPQLAALADRFRFLVPDARGFGKSGAADGPTTMTRMAQDGLALLDALGIGQAVVGGVSMGGYATLALMREDVSRVRGIILSDTQARADTAEAREGREQAAVTAETRGPEAVLEAMLPKLLSPGAAQDVKDAVGALIREASPAGIAAAQRGMAQRFDARELLARFSGPALIVVGEHDGITPPGVAKQLSEIAEGSRLEVIPGAGHLPNLEQPEAFNGVLASFLDTFAA